MGSANQADNHITELSRQLDTLRREREICLQDRIVIALTTAFEIETHSAELLTYLKEELRLSFLSNNFALISFSGTETDPDAMKSTPIWTHLVSPIYMDLRNIILSVVNFHHVGLTCDGGGHIICIVNFSEQTEDFHAEILALINQVNELVQKRCGLSFEVSVSELGAGITSLPELRRQVDILDEYRIAMGSHTPELLFYDKIFSSDQAYPESSLEINDQFIDYMESGEFEKAKRYFRETIVGNFVSSPPHPGMIRFRLSALIDYLVQTLYRVCTALGIQELLQKAGVPEILLGSTSIEALAEHLDGVFDLLSENWIFAGSAALKLAQDARSCINENYMNPDLNVNLVATHLNVTATHLTRSFQACYGCGVLEYLQRTRLNAAKKLSGSGLSIREIAMRTGYGSSLNMSRAFKRYEGKTPSEYLSKGS